MFATGPCRRWMVRFWPTRTQSLTREERNCSCRTPKALRHVSDSEASLGKCRGLRKSLWLEPGPDEVCIGHSTLEPSVLELQFFEAGGLPGFMRPYRGYQRESMATETSSARQTSARGGAKERHVEAIRGGRLQRTKSADRTLAALTPVSSRSRVRDTS